MRKRVTKLKNAHLDSVDMVNRGANQGAYVRLFKSDDYQKDEPPSKSTLHKTYDYLKRLFSEEDSLESDENNAATITKSDCTVEYTGYMGQLAKSFDTIINDTESSPEEVELLLLKSLDEFHEFMQDSAGNWANSLSVIKAKGDEYENSDLTGDDVDDFENDSDDDDMDDEPHRTRHTTTETTKTKKPDKEGVEKMDMSKLTPEEQATFKKLQAKANGSSETDAEKGCKTKTQKSETDPATVTESKTVTETKSETEKLPDLVVKALERMENMQKSIEMNEVRQIAKKFEQRDEEVEELTNTLYELKKSGSPMYEKSIALLQSTFDTQNALEKSGIFSEIGKSGGNYSGVGAGNTVLSKIDAKAADIMKADTSISKVQAVAKAWEDNPELTYEYEQEKNWR